MPLPVFTTLASKFLPSQYYVHIGLFAFAVAVVRAYCQGRVTDRERDLHARVVLITGAFTPIGLTILESLARRGAHVIAISPDPIDTPQVELMVDALRTLTENDRIHADHCDLTSPASIRTFCTQLLTGQEHRLDAIIFAHEYEHIGPLWNAKREEDDKKRLTASMATFLITTLLLPMLLVAPPERDIRIINVINPFYAAAIPTFSPSSTAKTLTHSTFVREGSRSLRTAIFTRHLQRVLDALPSAPAPDPDATAASVAGNKSQKSNVVAISVSPGLSRTDTMAPMLRANRTKPEFSISGFFLYLLLQPILRIVTKSPYYTMQSILHVLFLPTPFKRATVLVGPDASPLSDVRPKEILKPGALYSDCSVVPLKMPILLPKKNDKIEGSAEAAIVDDGEMGGEELGRLVWESYEELLKAWEKDHPAEAAGQPPAQVDSSVT